MLSTRGLNKNVLSGILLILNCEILDMVSGGCVSVNILAHAPYVGDSLAPSIILRVVVA